MGLVFLLATLNAYGEDWVYTVKPGDTLWHLCLKFTVNKKCWLQVGPYNNVAYPPSLAPGTRIRFPVAWLKAQPLAAKLVFVSGVVQIEQPNTPIKVAKVGDELTIGTIVTALAKSTATLQFADGATLVLEPESQVEMDRLSHHETTGMVDTRVNLNSGAIKTHVPKRDPHSQFEVNTPSAIAAVRGTEFRVSVDNKTTRNEVYESAIEVSNSAQTETIKIPTRFGLKVDAGTALGKPVALLNPVTWSDDATQVTSDYVVRWKSTRGAKGYKTEFFTINNSEELFFTESTITSELPIAKVDTPIAPNCFYVRVSAVSAEGLQGMPATKQLCVAAQLPAVTQLKFKRKTLSWQPLARAQTYRIEASKTPSFTEPLVLHTTDASSWPVPKQYQGFYLRVTALDAKGDAGVASKPVNGQSRNALEIFIATSLLIVLYTL